MMIDYDYDYDDDDKFQKDLLTERSYSCLLLYTQFKT